MTLKNARDKTSPSPPYLLEAVAKAIKDFPLINVSVDGTNIVVHKDINIGMAAALPSGNLIVPVVRAADQMNLMGITKTVNDLATRQKQSVETRRNTRWYFYTHQCWLLWQRDGNPIINQTPGSYFSRWSYKEKPAVIETPQGDMIGIVRCFYHYPMITV